MDEVEEMKSANKYMLDEIYENFYSSIVIVVTREINKILKFSVFYLARITRNRYLTYRKSQILKKKTINKNLSFYILH